MRTLLHTLFNFLQIITIWWNQDRVRHSNREGAIFQLQPNDRLLIERRIWRVQMRESSPPRLSVVLTLSLREEGDSGEERLLEIQVSDSERYPRISFGQCNHRKDQWRELNYDDIVVMRKDG